MVRLVREMKKGKSDMMAAVLSALLIVLSAIAVAPLGGARDGRAQNEQIQGTVTDASMGQPLADVNVHVFNVSMSYSDSTMTDETGHYQLTMPEGDYLVTMEFSHEGYLTTTKDHQFANASATVNASLVPMVSMVKGTVSSVGSPVSGADVLLIKSDGTGQMATVTNATGAFGFSLPGYGQTFKLRITAGGMYGFTDSFTLPLGAVKTETVVLEQIFAAGATVWGYVFNSSSSIPIDGARVSFTQRGSDRFIGDVTALGGYYTMAIPAGFFDVQVEAVGHLSFMTGLDVADGSNEQHDFLLSPVPVAGIKVSGSVKDSATSNAVAGAQVSLIDSNGARNSATTDGLGGYTITTYAGCFTLEAKATGYFSHSEALVVATSDITRDMVLLPVPAQNIKVWGYTKDITGKPVDSVAVTLYDIEPSHSGQLASTISATGGYYSVTTYPGHFLLVGEAAGLSMSIADITPATTQRQDIVLNFLAPRSTTETISFSDWNNITLGADVATQSTDGTTRWEIDHNFGNGDGSVTQGEADKYLSTIQERGPQYRDTKGYLSVDGVVYKYVDGTYSVTAENAAGADTNTTPIIIHYSYNLTSNTTVPVEKFHLLNYQASYNNAESAIRTTLAIPSAYEMRKVVQSTANISVNGTSSVVIVPLTQLPGDASGSEEVILNISQNEPPFADTGGNLTVKPGTLVVLDGSTSSDDTHIVNWSWDFADGATGYGAVVNHTYNITNGTTVDFTVKLTVTDTGGLVNSTTLRVTVDGKAPSAIFTTGNLTVQQNTEPFEVNASGSNDDINITRYHWDWGDGTTSESSAANPATNHTYYTAGPFVATLNVSDAAGNFATRNATVTVQDNVPPVARLVANVTVAPAGQLVEFNATTSSDNVDITQYVWDFGDNSSTVSGNRSQAGVVNHTFAAEKSYVVTVNVTDGRFWNATNVTIQITPPLIFADLQLQNLVFSKKDPVDGEKIQISVKMLNPGQKAGTNMTVRFMDGARKIKDVMVKSIEVNATKTITVDWTPKAGKHSIRVIFDALQQVPESNETNNEKSANITVGQNQLTTWIVVAAVVIAGAILGVYFYTRRRASRAEDEEDEEDEDDEEEDDEDDEEGSAEDEESECPKCYAEVKPSDKKCPSCGANLRR